MFKPTRHTQHATVWSYTFPNGNTATLIPDPHTPARFELCSTALNVPGDVIGGLTSEQVEARLADIALPAPLAPKSRVLHDGRAGIITHLDGQWALVLFDGETFAESIHVDDLHTVVAETPSVFDGADPVRTYSDGSQTYGPYTSGQEN